MLSLDSSTKLIWNLIHKTPGKIHLLCQLCNLSGTQTSGKHPYTRFYNYIFVTQCSSIELLGTLRYWMRWPLRTWSHPRWHGSWPPPFRGKYEPSDLCCASGRQNTLQQTDSVKESPESGVFAAMTLFKTTWELLAGCYLAFLISDEEFVLLYVCSFSKNLELLYEVYKRNGRFGVQSRVPYE